MKSAITLSLALVALGGVCRAAVTVGNPLVAAPNHDGASGSIFIMSTDENAAGEVTDFSFFDNDFSGRQITPLIVRSTGTGFEITGIGATQTSDGSGAQSAPFNLVSGSAQFGLGSALAWKDGSNGTNNAGTPEWFDAAPGQITWLGGGRTSFSAGDSYGVSGRFNRTYSVSAAIDTVGDLTGNTLVDRGSNDGAVGSIFVLDDPFNSNSFLRDWSFFDNDTAGRQMTPLLLTQGGAGWEVVGIGATRTSDGSGTQYYPFDLVSGSDFVGQSIFFGFKDGGNGSDNAGVADFDTIAGGPHVWWLGPNRTSFAAGDSFAVNGGFDRTYSIQAFAIPEPSIALSGLMGLAAIVLVRRRFRA